MKTKQIKLLMLALAMALSLNACDELIESTSPGADETNVSTKTSVKAKFGIALDGATVTPASFILEQNGQVVPALVEYYPDSQTAILTPIEKLGYELTYTATLKKSIKDEKGRTQSEDYSWSFRTKSSYGEPVGEHDIQGSPQDIKIKDNLAIMTTKANGLYIFDVSNPRAPVLLSNYTDVDSGLKLEVAGNYVYQAGFNLEIVDISNPSAPVKVGFFNAESVLGMRAYINNVHVEGDRAYLALDKYGFAVLDISDAANPRMVGHMNVAASMEEQYYPNSIKHRNGLIYLGAGNSGFQIIDINDLNAPVMLSSSPDSLADTFQLYGDYVVLTYRAYVEILDVSQPASPVRVTRMLPIQGMSAYVDIAIEGNLLYMADMTGGGVLILDLTKIAEPAIVKSYKASFPNGIEVAGDYIYTTSLLAGLFVYEK